MRRFADLLLVIGTGVILFAVAVVHARYRDSYDLTQFASPGGYATYLALLLLGAYGTGLPEIPRTLGGSLGSAAAAGIGSSAVFSLVQALTDPLLLPRFVVFATPVAVVPLYVSCWRLAQLGDARRRASERVLVIALADEAKAIAEDIDIAPERPVTIVGVIDPVTDGGSDDDDEIIRSAGALTATLLLLSERAQAQEHVVRQAALLHEGGMRVRTVAAFYDEWLGKLPISEIGRVSLMFDIGDVHQPLYTRTKRFIDVVVALLALPAVLSAVPFVVIGNLVANRGPLLFRQARVGRSGATFTMLKFRSMIPTATDDGAGTWTAADDPRITSFGRLLRRTHLDELPQALNVLAGDLSIVGPRPEQPHYVRELEAAIPFYSMRHVVRPGITGWAQVKWWYAASEIDTYQKLQYELYYLRHQGLALDTKICARTVRHVFRGWGT